MRPVPPTLLLGLISALCVLCAWQWHRENELRGIVSQQQIDLDALRAQRDEIEQRVRAADADILRLTASLEELRGNSVSRQEHEDVLSSNAQMREAIERQNAMLKQQNEAIEKANDAIQQVNETVKKVTAERDALAAQLNAVTEKYNALARKGGG